MNMQKTLIILNWVLSLLGLMFTESPLTVVLGFAWVVNATILLDHINKKKGS
jgi:hypothetical protein